MAPEESSSAGGGKGSLGAGGGAFCATGGGGSRTTSRWYRQPLLAVAIARAASVTSFPGIVMAAFLPIGWTLLSEKQFTRRAPAWSLRMARLVKARHQGRKEGERTVSLIGLAEQRGRPRHSFAAEASRQAPSVPVAVGARETPALVER